MPRYYDSNASAGGDGLTQATAWNTLDAANANMPGNDTLFASHLSDEVRSSGSVRFEFANHTSQTPIDVVSADFSSGEPPTVEAFGAKVTPANFNHIYFQEVGLVSGFHCNTLGSCYIGETGKYIEDCLFTWKVNDNTRRFIVSVSGQDQVGIFRRCRFNYRDEQQGITISRGGKIEFHDCSLEPGSNTQNFIRSASQDSGSVLIDGFDATGQAGGGFRMFHPDAIGQADNNGTSFSAVLNRVLLPVGGVILPSQPLYMGWSMDAYSVDTGDAFYRFMRSVVEGQVRESTSVYREGGAQYDKSSDPTEYQYSVQMDASAVARPFAPLHYPLFNRRLDANPTVKVQLAYDRAAGPWTNLDVWLEVQRPRAGARAVVDRVVSRPANRLGTGTVLATSSATWTHSFTDPVFSEIELPITGGGAGIHRGTLCFAPGVAATLYGCPRFEVS